MTTLHQRVLTIIEQYDVLPSNVELAETIIAQAGPEDYLEMLRAALPQYIARTVTSLKNVSVDLSSVLTPVNSGASVATLEAPVKAKASQTYMQPSPLAKASQKRHAAIEKLISVPYASPEGRKSLGLFTASDLEYHAKYQIERRNSAESARALMERLLVELSVEDVLTVADLSDAAIASAFDNN